MTTTQTTNREASHGAYGQAVLAETLDDVRYIVMRALRTVAYLTLMPMCLASVMAAMVCWLIPLIEYSPAEFSHLSWWQLAFYYHPVLAELATIAIAAVTLVLAIAVWTPYWLETTKPGLDVRTCGVCGVQVPNRWKCGNCKAFRAVKIVTEIIWLLSLAITIFNLTVFCVAIFAYWLTKK